MTTRILFILKRREDYSQDPSYSQSYQIATGMFNSAKFVVNELNATGQDRVADFALVVDSNGIDAAVTSFNPTHVIIEGLWVVPQKFRELKSLWRHKMAHNGAGRQWIVRIHSEMPFIATEGIAMEWEAAYVREGVVVAPNAPRAYEQVLWHIQNLTDVADLPAAPETLVKYLPNCYPTNFEPINLSRLSADKPTLDIACFGAFRPLKNQLQQAFVAAQYAQKMGKQLRFHINGRTDSGGQGPMKNVISMLRSVGAEIVEHGWEDRETFLQSLRECDVLLQVSLSETFNIVAADATFVGIPVLASSEIRWLYPLFANPTEVNDCIDKLGILMTAKAFFINGNRAGLRRYARSSSRIWNEYIPR